jgi:hypothetical protein
VPYKGSRSAKSHPTNHLQRLARAQALGLDGIDKGNFDGSLDPDATANATANGTADGTDDGSLDFYGTMLSSETYMMPISNPSSEPSSNL